MSAPLSAKEAQSKALRDGIAEMASQCTPSQVALLHKIHDAAPWKGLANCPDDKLSETYGLLRRTVIATGDSHERP